MPIHDQSYRHWEGELKSHTFRWWVIASESLKIILKRKLFLIFILIPALIQFFVFGGLIYGVNTYGIFANLKIITPEFFYKFCMRQTFFIALICIFAGSGLIANDLKSNALQLYLSKPLTRFDYIVGKVVAILIMLEGITLVPGILLLIEHLALSQDFAFIQENYWLIGSIILFSFVLSLPTTFMTLAFSSITKNYRYSAIFFMSIAFGTPVIGNLLKIIFSEEWADYIQYWRNLEIIGMKIFDVPKYSPPWHWSALIIIAITLICAYIMYKRIRGVEIVK